MRARSLLLVAGVAFALTLPGCTSATLMRSPHDQYVDMLRRAGLDQTALGQAWRQASETALMQPVTIATPFRETGYFPPGEALAVGYRLELQRGRELAVSVSFESSEPARLFVDLFEMRPNAAPRRVASLDADRSELTHEIDRDATYVLRLQPELLRGGRFTLTQRTLSTLLFPVPGLTARAAQSLFGAARDAGAREHEGVDIFASRGTPVVAVRSGLARVDTNALGGNVVWLRDGAGRRTFYYAHLDRWALRGTSLVSEGDVLGYVGNTGNARTTAPHLHFGIYEGGAIDPLPFLQPDEDPPPAPTARVDRLGEMVRVQAARTALRDGPSAEVRTQLARGTLARVFGVASTSARVALPDRSLGYVADAAISLAATPLRRARSAGAVVLRERPDGTAPVVDEIEDGSEVDVLGDFGNYELWRVPNGPSGWIERGRATSVHTPRTVGR
jgi:murein DD-endopeptidase MepM/ murein hydrolase activator NlpD